MVYIYEVSELCVMLPRNGPLTIRTALNVPTSISKVTVTIQVNKWQHSKQGFLKNDIVLINVFPLHTH